MPPVASLPHGASAPLQRINKILLEIASSAIGLDLQNTARRQRIQAFLDSCQNLKALLEQVWIVEWGASEALRAGMQDIETRLSKVMEDCTTWKAGWKLSQRIEPDDELDNALQDWQRRITDCWRSYQAYLQLEVISALKSRPTSLAPLLRKEEAIPLLKEAAAECTPTQRGEMGAFIEASSKQLQSTEGWTEEQAIIFRALRSMLTVESVPKSVQLTGEVVTIRIAVIKNRASYIDEGLFEEKRVAIKRVRDSDIKPERVERLLYEGAMWRMLHHPNILPFYGILRQPGEFGTSIALVSEWAANRDIMTFLKGSPDWDRRTLILGVADGLVYLHDLGLIHGAIRGSNILIDEKHVPRVTDFALTSPGSRHGRVESPGPSGTEPCEIVRWLAPELMSGWKPTTATDVFSFGRTIFEIMIGADPVYQEYNDLPMMMLCLLDQGRLRAKKPGEGLVRERGLTDDLWEWLEIMWAFPPHCRPNIMLVRTKLQGFWGL